MVYFSKAYIAIDPPCTRGRVLLEKDTPRRCGLINREILKSPTIEIPTL
jgi:hypothetical protein